MQLFTKHRIQNFDIGYTLFEPPGPAPDNCANTNGHISIVSGSIFRQPDLYEHCNFKTGSVATQLMLKYAILKPAGHL